MACDVLKLKVESKNEQHQRAAGCFKVLEKQGRRRHKGQRLPVPFHWETLRDSVTIYLHTN